MPNQDIPSHLEQPKRRRVGVAIVFLVAVLLLTTQYLAGHEKGRPYWYAVFLVVGMPLLMWLLTLGLGGATRRRFGSFVTVLVGIGISGVVGIVLGFAIWTLAQYAPILTPRADQPWKLYRAILFGFAFGQMSFGLWALAFVFPFALEDARVRSLEAETLRLEAEKLRSAAELARLRAHLEPHFLLNTLNAIAGLVTEDPREARRLLVCLGDLLRDALRDEDEMQTLDDQIVWLRRYAEILEARHPGGLAFRWEIGSGSGEVLLPRLLLQPLVENAVKHGALKRDGGGEVVVRAEVVSGEGATRSTVVCTVEDNGPGLSSSETRSGAFGLHAVRRRLELKYPEGASLRLESTDAGTRSIVQFPRQSALTLARAAS